MLWSTDSCQNRVSADQHHLTVLRAQVSIRCQVASRSSILKLSADKLLVFRWSQAQVFFILFYEICCVYVPLGINFNFKLTSDTKIQPAITGREDSCFWLFSPWSRVGHALRPIFMLWLVKIIKGEFMRKIYAASWILFTLTAKADRIVSTCDALNCFFSTGCTKWNSAYNKLSKQHRLQEYSKCRASSNAFKEYTSL